MMQVEPPSLDIAAHHVGAAIVHIAIAGAKFIECQDHPVALLVLTFASDENLLARGALQRIDVSFVGRA